MRAWQIQQNGEPETALELGEANLPEPGPGQLRLEVRATGVGLPDLLMCRGSYALRPRIPFTPGQEVVGIVRSAGEGARARMGERVMAVTAFYLGHGGFAESCIALDEFAPSVPEAMSDAEAAGFVIPFWTAHVALVGRAALQPGETLLVLGASGGTGSAAVQLGKALGARVLAVVAGPRKALFCRELGADVVIDRETEDVETAVREATGGAGAHVAFDPVGGSAFESASRVMAREGRILAIGFASGSWGRPDMGHLVNHNLTVMGVLPTGWSRRFVREAEATLLDHWRAGRIRVPVHRAWPFEQVPQAVAELAGAAVLGKAVVHGPSA